MIKKLQCKNKWRKRLKYIISLFKPEMNNSSNAQISYDKTKEKRTDLYRSGGKLDSNGGF